MKFFFISTVYFDSKGAGDLNIKCEVPSRSLVNEIYVTDLGGFETGDTSRKTGWMTPQYQLPVIVTGEIRKDGWWGGVRIYGTDSNHNYIFLSQNSGNSRESEKIRYNLPSSWVSFKAIIGNGQVSLYIDDQLFQTINTDTTGTVSVWGGSNANPVNVTNLEIRYFTMI